MSETPAWDYEISEVVEEEHVPARERAVELFFLIGARFYYGGIAVTFTPTHKGELVVQVPLPIPTLVKIRYRSAMVDLWAGNGRVAQIMVHDGYRGKLMGKIGLGSTIADIERYIGAVEEDEDDSLVIRDFPGLFFEIEGYFPDLQKDPAYRYAPIKEIYVHTTPLEWHYFEPGTAMWT